MLDSRSVRTYLETGDFAGLFCQMLNWNACGSLSVEAHVDEHVYHVQSIAEQGATVFLCRLGAGQVMPDHRARAAIETQVTRQARENLIVFVDSTGDQQIWCRVKRTIGKADRRREHTWFRRQSATGLAARLSGIAFALSELDDDGRALVNETERRLDESFLPERITKRFYADFDRAKVEFTGHINGMGDLRDRNEYAEVVMNRLMFLYFVQTKGFLAQDTHYLNHLLDRSSITRLDGFYANALCPLFFDALAVPKESRLEPAKTQFSNIPYLNGGLFRRHRLERDNPHITIDDGAFEGVFGFLNAWDWVLDTRPRRSAREIDPAILGYIFERYINRQGGQRDKGAYYTREDITGYITENTILPSVFARVAAMYPDVLRAEGPVWSMLKSSPEQYIYPAVSKGMELALPEGIAAGIDDVGARGNWNDRAVEAYALPTETWREVVARRQRYAALRQDVAAGRVCTAEDMVARNMNLMQLVLDAIEATDDAGVVRAFYMAVAGAPARRSSDLPISSLTVLDPTCGSGAFLLSAVEVLEPIYEVCLRRMRDMTENLHRAPAGRGPKPLADFDATLADIDRHPNEAYFIVKKIIVGNLYGVDIMPEAVDICKLRLFLKLVAQLQQGDQVEPLPDIDFNIRSGNTLVGTVSKEDIALVTDGHLDVDHTWDELEGAMSDTDHAWVDFQRCQVELQSTPEDIAQARKLLEGRLVALRGRLDHSLAATQDIRPTDARALNDWQSRSQPFHWLAEFYGVLHREHGFHAIIGNPPYVEYNEDKLGYRLSGYDTQSCGNLYAYVMERCKKMLNPHGYCGMIVPLSGHSTERMSPLIESFYHKASFLCLTNYSGDANPSHLFEGVKFRLAIFIAGFGSGPHREYVGPYLRWYAEERHADERLLFQRLAPTPTPGELLCGSIPKYAGPMHIAVIKKTLTKRATLTQQPGKYVTYYHNAPVMWIRSHDFVPYFKHEAGGKKKSGHLKPLAFRTQDLALATTAILSSSLFYLWWITVSDCYDLVAGHIDMFPFDTSVRETVLELAKRARELEADLKANSRRRVYIYKNTGRLEYDEYYVKKSKAIIDCIDDALGSYYGFTSEELDFVKNYEIKYRLGAELSDDDGEDAS